MSAHLQKSSGVKFHKYVPFQDQIEVHLPDRTWPDQVMTKAPRWCAVDLRDGKGDSLLMLASYHGRLAATSVLRDHGADAQLANRRGHTPLAGAAFKGDLPMVRLLVERGTDVESPCADGKTALMMAAMFNHTAIVEWLVAQGADPHATDAGGTTPLAAARMMGASEAVALLQRIAAAQA